MSVIHVEDNQITREALAHALGVRDWRVGGYEYVSTSVPSVAADELRRGKAHALILDIGLTPFQSPDLLQWLGRQARGDRTQEPAEPEGAQSWRPEAYRLALLAYHSKVPCALLTNWADYPDPQTGQRYPLEVLRDIFHAKAVFPKDEAGILKCADWIREMLKNYPR
jgi:hypothetical protein